MEPQPSSPEDKDEVLGALARFERLLKRVIEGIFVFFIHRIPKWTYELIRGVLEHLRHYFERLIRITIRLVRVAFWLVILVGVVVGPGVAMLYWNAPQPILYIWCVLILCAMLFGLQRYARKEYERIKNERQKRRGVKLKCAQCGTHDPNNPSPKICRFCGCKPWVGVPI
jgi:hypothetical protein